MSEEKKTLAGPDFANGVPVADLTEGGIILGQVSGEAVLLARTGGALFAIGAECTHYHGPLAEGVLVNDTVRCPWHHACFSLRTGGSTALHKLWGFASEQGRHIQEGRESRFEEAELVVAVASAVSLYLLRCHARAQPSHSG